MKKINILSIFILLSSIVVACLITLLPDVVPVHVNINGEVDRYGSKWIVLLGPIIACVATILIQIFLRKTKNKSLEALQIMMTVILAVFVGVCWLPYIITTKVGLVNIQIIMGIFIGAMFIFMGNYMGLLKMNKIIGIRVKWTFADEEIWQKTHRLGGYIMVVTGLTLLIMTLIGFFLNINLIFVSILILVLISILIPILYSYLLYKRKYS